VPPLVKMPGHHDVACLLYGTEEAATVAAPLTPA
jgi:hypothetical protein